MAYKSGLGILPVIVAAVANPKTLNAIISDIGSLFQGSSYDATHQKILTMSTSIAANPDAAATPGTSQYQAWINLRCWAGDQSIASIYAQLFSDPSAMTQGCGCEVSHGCRADAQATVGYLKTQFPQLVTGVLNSNPYPGPSGNSGGSGSYSGGGTLPINVGPGTYQLPVGSSTILNGTLFGVPVWLLGLGVAAVAFGGGRGGRRSA